MKTISEVACTRCEIRCRQVAIEWLKDFEKSPCFENKGLILWLKDFFEIKEEDLND